ncbi:MAG: hypothetical protein ACREFD_19240 [Stellaceae bacterium]
MAAKPEAGTGWYVQLFGQLCYQVLSEYSALKRAYDDEQNGEAALLAWRARNLLELSVWATYFSKSSDNARRLYEDAGRDAGELFGTFEKWGQKSGQSSNWLNSLASGIAGLAARAQGEGITTLDVRYMRVDDAAATCGWKDQYKIMSKMLSKFVHPTALQILGVDDDAKQSLQRECFFSLGCLFFTGAFNALENLQAANEANK